MHTPEETIRRVSTTALPQLRAIIEGVRDAALEVAGQGDKEWESMMIDWHGSEVCAILSNLGRNSIGLTLNAGIYSSNGVHAKSTFEASIQDYEVGQAYETWATNWTHPYPGNSFGHREGDSAVAQLNTEVSRFIDPITAATVSVSVS